MINIVFSKDTIFLSKLQSSNTSVIKAIKQKGYNMCTRSNFSVLIDSILYNALSL